MIYYYGNVKLRNLINCIFNYIFINAGRTFYLQDIILKFKKLYSSAIKFIWWENDLYNFHRILFRNCIPINFILKGISRSTIDLIKVTIVSDLDLLCTFTTFFLLLKYIQWKPNLKKTNKKPHNCGWMGEDSII